MSQVKVPARCEFREHDNVGIDLINVVDDDLGVGIKVAKHGCELNAGDAHQKVVVKLKIGV
jgi:hypothetical protein